MSVHEEHDIFRHTPLRYFGYLNEIGEAFRYNISFKTLVIAYGLSFGYIVGDTVDKSYKSYVKFHDQKHESKEVIRNKVLKSGGCSLAWQLIATELVPAFIVYQVVKFSKNRVKYIKSPFWKKWGPTSIGLCLIPLFPHTVDPLVDKVFDKLNLSLDNDL